MTTAVTQTSDTFIRTLDQLCQTLGTKDASTGILEVAIADLLLEEQNIEMEIYRKRRILARIRERRQFAETHHEIVKRTLAEVEESRDVESQRSTEWQTNIRILEQKAAEYNARLETLYSMTEPGMDELSFDQLQQIRKELEDAEKALETKWNVLKGYQDMPPIVTKDITLAKIALGEKKQELADLLDKRQKLLERMAR
ncbi:hypothetical protein HDV05_006185 [Chytridiales sp. JEL 0842]|nr:hypothetical protein HDV05_006185 [Chytridiales sp. JEL 0842]